MEALTSRSPNVIVKQNALPKKETLNMQPSTVRITQKEKEPVERPPYYVSEPNGPDGEFGEKYKTGRLLGKGGFAVCFQGELCNEGHGNRITEFALKIVKTQMGQKKMLEKFRTELQIHSKLRHPNIVQFHRAFTFQDSTYVVLELCHNGSVMDMVRQRRCLSLPEVRRMAIQLCGAIKYMHKRNVIHRDLKMGNLFLDADMNIKVGDFGLAAILVTDKEAGFARRTTLCGTPNYIAPEILEKGRRGHDHKVDIWAIGVIVFAMLTGYPPFQSSTQDEIYRKVKDLNYAWPADGKSHNYIPEEAKSLVKSLLKVDAAERPEPDDVVGHEFFLMHNGNGIPGILDSDCRRGKPAWLANQHPMGDAMDTRVKVSWADICRNCGVGRDFGTQCFPVVGEYATKTLYKQCVEEEFHGRTPIVPVPAHMVYISYPGPKHWPPLLHVNASGEPDTAIAKQQTDETSTALQKEDDPHKQHSESQGLNIPFTAGASLRNNPSVTGRPRRAEPQSHAAQLRQKEQPAVKGILKPSRTRVAPSILPFQTVPASLNKAPRAVSTRVKLSDLPPRRPSRSPPVITPFDVVSRREPSRSTRANTAKTEPETETSSSATIEKRGVTKATNTSLETVDAANSEGNDFSNRGLRTRSSTTRVRIESAVAGDSVGGAKVSTKSSNSALPSKSTLKPGRREEGSEKPSKPSQSLIGPEEAAETVPFTSSVSVRQGLKVIYTNLEHSIDIAALSKNLGVDVPLTKPDSVITRPAVSKWVDYSNKFGIGYILNDGTVGCVFKGENGNAPSCVAVRGGEEHLRNRSLDTFPDKHQIVPKNGQPVEFFENCGDPGFKRVVVPPTEFQVDMSKAGTAEKFGPGKDSFEYQKRRNIWLYDKFANYMTKGLGKSEEDQPTPAKEAPSGKGRPSRTMVKPFVKFYQRIGNVGVWGFGSGAFQFNFPDHTKLVISHDGKWCDFYHLPIQAAAYLKRNRALPKEFLDNRDVLSYPVPVLLQGHYTPKPSKTSSASSTSLSQPPHNFEDVVLSNQLREKLAFIRDVTRRWYMCGGIGCLGNGEEAKMKWEGMAERNVAGKPEKLVWVSIGARGGDSRVEELVGERVAS